MSKHFELQLLLKLSPSPLLLMNRWLLHYPGFIYPISNLSLFCLFPHYCYIFFSLLVWHLLPWKGLKRSRMQWAYTWSGIKDRSSASESANLSPGPVFENFSTLGSMSMNLGPWTKFILFGKVGGIAECN